MFTNSRINFFYIQVFPVDGADDHDDDEAPVRKRKRISNAETIELMMKSEVERQRVINQMLEILNGFREQGAEKLNLLKHIVDDGKPRGLNWID